QAIGLEHTSAGSSAFLTFAGTSFAALFAWPLLGQEPGGRLLGGIGLALAGATLLRVGYLVLAGSVIAPVLQVIAQRDLPAGRIGLLFTLEPLFALAFAVTLGGERFDARWWLGAALILAAVVGVEARPSR